MWYNVFNTLTVDIPGSKGLKVDLGPGAEAVRISSATEEHRLGKMDSAYMRKRPLAYFLGFGDLHDAGCVMRFRRNVGRVAIGGIRLYDHGGMIRNIQAAQYLQNMFPECRVSIGGCFYEGRPHFKRGTYDSSDDFLCHVYGLPEHMTSEEFEALIAFQVMEQQPYRIVPVESRIFGTVVPVDLKHMTRDRVIKQFFETVHKRNLDVKLRGIDGEQRVEDLTLTLTGKYEDLRELSENMSIHGWDCDWPYIEPYCKFTRTIPIFKSDKEYLRECFSGCFPVLPSAEVIIDDGSDQVILSHPKLSVLETTYPAYVNFIKQQLERKPASPGQECGLCGNQYGLVTLSCGHVLCRECITIFVDVAMQRREFPLRCSECEAVIGLSDLLRWFLYDMETLQKLALKSFECHLQAMVPGVGVVRCSTPDCLGFFLNRDPRYQKCSECETEQCVECCGPAHSDLSCQVYGLFQDTYGEMREWFKQDADNRKYCPQCFNAIEKEGGCMHVECVLCKTHFCWVCLKMLPSSPDVHLHVADNHIGVLVALD